MRGIVSLKDNRRPCVWNVQTMQTPHPSPWHPGDRYPEPSCCEPTCSIWFDLIQSRESRRLDPGQGAASREFNAQPPIQIWKAQVTTNKAEFSEQSGLLGWYRAISCSVFWSLASEDLVGQKKQFWNQRTIISSAVSLEFILEISVQEDNLEEPSVHPSTQDIHTQRQ